MAAQESYRAILVPVVTMLFAVLLLSGLLAFLEPYGGPTLPDSGNGSTAPPFDSAAMTGRGFENAFEAFWAVVVLVTSLSNGSNAWTHSAPGRVVWIVSVFVGLLLATMPITIIGKAYENAWVKKDVIEVMVRIQSLLAERGLKTWEVERVLHEFDFNEPYGELSWEEFLHAMRVLRITMPDRKLRALFQMFDADSSGAIDYGEFVRLVFPNLDFGHGQGARPSAAHADSQAYSEALADEAPQAEPAQTTTTTTTRFGALLKAGFGSRRWAQRSMQRVHAMHAADSDPDPASAAEGAIGLTKPGNAHAAALSRSSTAPVSLTSPAGQSILDEARAEAARIRKLQMETTLVGVNERLERLEEQVGAMRSDVKEILTLLQARPK